MVRSTHCREFHLLKLCTPAYFVRTTPFFPPLEMTIYKHWQGGMSSNFVGVGKLLADSPSASTLRAIIIDKQASCTSRQKFTINEVRKMEVFHHLNVVKKEGQMNSIEFPKCRIFNKRSLLSKLDC